MALYVSVLTPEKIIFNGKADSVIVPGEQGVFEVLPFHKRILSRLLSGTLYIDEYCISIVRGVIVANYNKVSIVVEER